jgi:hypothetical protein
MESVDTLIVQIDEAVSLIATSDYAVVFDPLFGGEPYVWHPGIDL